MSIERESLRADDGKKNLPSNSHTHSHFGMEDGRDHFFAGDEFPFRIKIINLVTQHLGMWTGFGFMILLGLYHDSISL